MLHAGITVCFQHAHDEALHAPAMDVLQFAMRKQKLHAFRHMVVSQKSAHMHKVCAGSCRGTLTVQDSHGLYSDCAWKAALTLSASGPFAARNQKRSSMALLNTT